MPLIEIKCDPLKIKPPTKVILGKLLPPVAAKALTCVQGGTLKPKDIMIEFSDFSPFDKNVKDIHVRVIAHDYPVRRDECDLIRKRISSTVLQCLADDDIRWYVWVLLSYTSYGSDTDFDGVLAAVLTAIEQRKDPSYRALSAYELAPGVAAVHDTLGEIDIYFDLSMWDYTYPQIWQRKDGAIPNKNIIPGVGILPGVGRFPPVASMSMAFELAQEQLTATTSAQWHSEPLQVKK